VYPEHGWPVRKPQLPRTAIAFAGDLDNRKVSHLLMNQSHGWLLSAESVITGAVCQDESGGVYHCLPALFALYHGVELFLKGATSELTEQYDARSHDLKHLLHDYDKSVTQVARHDLRIKANVLRLIEWDSKCRSGSPKKLPHGSDLRFILDTENRPSWPGVSIRFKDVVDWSREYRRDFSRIRRLLLDVKGFDAFWEEGTFSAMYPDLPLWFFCLGGSVHGRAEPSGPWEHHVRDERDRDWIALEGEAINENNCFIASSGKLPGPTVRLECPHRELSGRLSAVD